MLNDINFISQSIEANLTYGLAIREMALDLKLSFLEKDEQIQDTTRSFFRAFDALVNETLDIADGNVPQEMIDDQIVATNYTLDMYILTEQLTGVNMDQELILKLEKIKAGIPKPTPELIKKVEEINNQAVILLTNFKKFLEQLYDDVINVRLFIFSYGLLIEHLIQRIDLYYYSMDRLIHREKYSPTYVAKVQYDFNNLVKQDTKFINAFVNQTERDVMEEARKYEQNFEMLLKTYQIPLTPDNQKLLSERSYALNASFAEFVKGLLDRINNRDIQFMVEPVFIDLILRESNMFKFILSGNLKELGE